MYLAQDIHRVMKRAAQRRDLFLLKTNETCYRIEEAYETNKPYLL